MITFQKLLSTLTEFWANQGCAIHQGHDIEVGAATFNPATFLRSLGPEPYNAVYVEPSRRPQDGRYGENPNRMHVFHQMQVILKPSPFDIQAMYLKSLEAIGFDLSKHDIRFVHDDWEGPTLGAWGLGWEVWIDGMEITQFTYFQAVGGLPLNPIMVEIAYGLERLGMILQNVDNAYHMKWNDTLTYGDVVHRNEVEWSHYNFTEASTSMWFQHFQDFEKEAKQLIEKKLPIPAYDFVMKASHAFNILEARGVLSVTERTGYITRIRDLAKGVAECYVEIRKQLGYPLLKAPLSVPQKELEQSEIKHTYNYQTERDFLLEVGSEELPAASIRPGFLSLERLLVKFFKDYGIPFKTIEVYGTPRRLVAIVKGLKEGTQDSIIEKKGPAINVAFDTTGSMTSQGLGFIKTLNLDPIKLTDIKCRISLCKTYRKRTLYFCFTGKRAPIHDSSNPFS
jgi:glycyl-tRNA synthetase